MKTKKKSSIEVSKNSENEDIKLSNRIIDLFIWYQIEDSNAWLRVLESQVKFLEERRKQLFDNLDMCLFKFQKKKINEELEQIEKELFKQYEKIGEEVDIMNKLNLPESVIGSGDGNGSYMQDVFHVTGNAQVTMKNIMAAVIAAKLAGLALNAIIYIAVYLVVFAILKIVFAVTGVVGRLPLIYQANKILGLAFGILEGLVIVWLLFAVITACSNMQWAAKALIEIGKNDLLSIIYNHNFIIKTITKTV